MQTIRLFTLLGILSLLYSCGRVTEENTPWQLRSLPVVFSVISPDNPVQVYLAKTIVMGEKRDTLYYPEAKVFFSDENKVEVELARHSLEKAVYTDTTGIISVVQGNTYHLRVLLPSGEVLTAQTTIPTEKGRILSATYTEIDPEISNSVHGNATLSAKLALPDRYKCQLLYNTTWHVGEEVFLISDNIVEMIYRQDESEELGLHLITVDPYLASYLLAERANSSNDFDNGDILAMIGAYNGLMPPFSNIVNGIGLFGSYLSDKTTVNLVK